MCASPCSCSAACCASTRRNTPGAAARASCCGRRQLMWGSNLFHVGILVIFAGHFVGLLTPVAVFDALGISHTFKQLLAMSVGGIAGDRLLRRHHPAGAPATVRSAHPRHVELRRHRDPADALGAADAGPARPFRSRRSIWTAHEMVKFMTWAQGIVTLHPGAADAGRRRQSDLQAASVPGHDHLPGLPVHPAGACVERAGLVSRPPRLPDRAQPGRSARSVARPIARSAGGKSMRIATGTGE